MKYFIPLLMFVSGTANALSIRSTGAGSEVTTQTSAGGLANYVPVFLSSFTIGNSVSPLYESSAGRFGVGITTPAASLDVSGNAQFGGGATKSTFTSAGNLSLVAGATVTSNGSLIISTSATSASAVPNLFLSPNGFDGINTASPVYQLDITGGERASGQIIAQGSGTIQGASGLSVTYGVSAASVTTTSYIISYGTETVIGNSFSVGVTTFQVTNGSVTIAGTTFADAATVGAVGEYLSTTTIQTTPGASGTWIAIATFTLTAGDWDVSALCVMATGGTSAGTGIICAISSSGTGADTSAGMARADHGYTWLANSTYALAMGPRRVNISATTAYYLMGQLAYTTLGGATWSTNTTLSARRVR